MQKTDTIERRTLQTRNLAVSESEPNEIIGYAAVFNQWSEDLGGFREMILPGAFSNALNDDVRALINHDANLVLGRTRSGTLVLTEDEVGLRIKITLPNTQYARDLVEAMRRGDVDQMSFGFAVETDRWYEQDGQTRREIVKVARLYDVSVVTFPAYPQTIAQARDVLNMRKESGKGVQVETEPKRDTDSGQEQLEVKRKKIQIFDLERRS